MSRLDSYPESKNNDFNGINRAPANTKPMKRLSTAKAKNPTNVKNTIFTNKMRAFKHPERAGSGEEAVRIAEAGGSGGIPSIEEPLV